MNPLEKIPKSLTAQPPTPPPTIYCHCQLRSPSSARKNTIKWLLGAKGGVLSKPPSLADKLNVLKPDRTEPNRIRNKVNRTEFNRIQFGSNSVKNRTNRIKPISTVFSQNTFFFIFCFLFPDSSDLIQFFYNL
ncbi:hypothetical protein R6Q59_036115 [Mikania micrantha]